MRVSVAVLALGVIAVLAATLLGTSGRILEAIVTPPPLVRAALVGLWAVVALWLLVRALAALAGGDAPALEEADVPASAERDMPTMIRGIRLAFLAVAAVAAGAGWLFGQPVLLIVALVIAGVDVVETTFLLIVARRHRIDDPRA